MTSTALALKIAAQPSISSNLPSIADMHVYSNAIEDEILTKSGDCDSLRGYRVVDIQRGTIDRARELHDRREMRHCFNEPAIIKMLESKGEEFDIVEVVSNGFTPKYIAGSNNSSGFSRYLMVPHNK